MTIAATIHVGRAIACCALLALAPAIAFAEPTAPTAATATTAAPTAAPKPAPALIWEVRSKTATVYLLGSVHVASAAMYPLDPRIEQAFARSDALVLETPMDPAAQARAAALMQQAGMYAAPDSLDKHVDPQLLEQLTRALAEVGLPVAAVLPMKPWLASITLMLLKLDALGYKPELGIDQHFQKAAGDKRLGALETLEQQVALFADMPEATQVAALRQALSQLHELPDLMQRTVDAWRRGDSAAIDALLVEPTRKEYPELHRRLLAERNMRIAATIDGYLKGQGTTFVVVGSGHLVGQGSIVRLLEARGHKPKQL
jgi:uncharacterized protein YbaP (TraB family)